MSIRIYGETYVKECRLIRLLACSGKIKLVNNSNMKVVERILKACREESEVTSIEEFIKLFISSFQPFQFEQFRHRWDKCGNHVWTLDFGFGIRMSVTHKKEELIVSFNNQRIKKVELDKKHRCIIDVERVKEIEGKQYRIEFTIQKSFIRSTIRLNIDNYKNGISIVGYDKIIEEYEHMLTNEIASYIKGLNSEFKKRLILEMISTNKDIDIKQLTEYLEA